MTDPRRAKAPAGNRGEREIQQDHQRTPILSLAALAGADFSAASRTSLELFDAGQAVGVHDGYLRGHIAGYDVGYAQGRADLAAEIEQRESTERDAANRELVVAHANRPSFAELQRRRRSAVQFPTWDLAAEQERCARSWAVVA